jgi:hypothetical protein
MSSRHTMECDSVADTRKAISYFNQQVNILGMLSIIPRHYIFQQVIFEECYQVNKNNYGVEQFRGSYFLDN